MEHHTFTSWDWAPPRFARYCDSKGRKYTGNCHTPRGQWLTATNDFHWGNLYFPKGSLFRLNERGFYRESTWECRLAEDRRPTWGGQRY